MQKITITEVTPSSGENKPTIIVDSSGAKMSGFDFALKDLHPGDIIEAELEVKGKYTNIKTFNIIDKASPEKTAEIQHQNGKEKQAEIIARAKNTALMQAVELATADKIKLDEITKYADTFLFWLMPDKLEGTVKDPSSQTVQSKSTDEVDENAIIIPLEDLKSAIENLDAPDLIVKLKKKYGITAKSLKGAMKQLSQAKQEEFYKEILDQIEELEPDEIPF